MNKKVEHTPGPWKLDGAEITDGEIVIALCSSTKANARLIAAAPHLMAAVSACNKMFAEMGLDKMAEFTRTQKTAFDLCLTATAKTNGGPK